MVDHDDIWSQAIQEAYAMAPADEVILSTLELRHPTFAVPVRLVLDNGDQFIIDDQLVWGHYLKLENFAPAQANQTVLFQSCIFNFELPEQKEGALPAMTVEIDNVTKDVLKYLDAAVAVRAPMELSYREYLASDKTVPQFTLHGLTFKDVRSNLSRITGTAQFGDLVNKSFPRKLYRPSEFQGLVA